MTVYIVCPNQETEGFSPDVCRKCNSFQAAWNGEKLSISCRKQKTRKHKLNFQSAILTDMIGRPDKVVVEAKIDNSGA